MTMAGQSLAWFARWLDASSASRLSPCAHKRRAPRRGLLGARMPVVERYDDILVKGRFAELLPHDFNEPFNGEFGEQSLPLLVSFEHCDGLTLPEAADLSPYPPGQPRVAERVASVRFNAETAAKPHLSPWLGKNGNGWPALCLIGLGDPLQPVADAISAAGADDLDPHVPVIAIPLWRGFSRKERANVALPFVP
ncbi:hypothetical protein [Blastomonas sp.]|uniref:hypothetical protein n=1 Tax=Blastomonas sp. TaxID=1909299 RepID=UPI002605490B|nr:hypothetical protein [Blastomonas sp.]MDM7956602.1 hypothetical protein [Blastomonas sp.]